MMALSGMEALAGTDARMGEEMSYAFGSETAKVIQYDETVYEILPPEQSVYGVSPQDRPEAGQARKTVVASLESAGLSAYEFLGIEGLASQEALAGKSISEQVALDPLSVASVIIVDGEELPYQVLVLRTVDQAGKEQCVRFGFAWLDGAWRLVRVSQSAFAL
ncbi:MAG: hypothetical protein RSC06_13590 [Clostridia bacterium]